MLEVANSACQFFRCVANCWVVWEIEPPVRPEQIRRPKTTPTHMEINVSWAYAQSPGPSHGFTFSSAPPPNPLQWTQEIGQFWLKSTKDFDVLGAFRKILSHLGRDRAGLSPQIPPDPRGGRSLYSTVHS